jgi:hypothetical protein
MSNLKLQIFGVAYITQMCVVIFFRIFERVLSFQNNCSHRSYLKPDPTQVFPLSLETHFFERKWQNRSTNTQIYTKNHRIDCECLNISRNKGLRQVANHKIPEDLAGGGSRRRRRKHAEQAIRGVRGDWKGRNAPQPWPTAGTFVAWTGARRRRNPGSRHVGAAVLAEEDGNEIFGWS